MTKSKTYEEFVEKFKPKKATDEMKKLLVFMLAVLIAVTSPERFKVNYICPHQYRLCFYMDVLPGVEIVP